MKYTFSRRGLKDLEKTSDFYKELYGDQKAKFIITGLFDFIDVLISQNDFSKIGSIDNQFVNHKLEYRKVFYRYLRITYRVGKEEILIVRIFDARQNPKKNL